MPSDPGQPGLPDPGIDSAVETAVPDLDRDTGIADEASAADPFLPDPALETVEVVMPEAEAAGDLAPEPVPEAGSDGGPDPAPDPAPDATADPSPDPAVDPGADSVADPAADTPPDAVPDASTPHAGTFADPIPVDSFPFVTVSTTLGAGSAVNGYDCAASTPEAGPERVYAVHLPAKGTLRVEVLDGSSVDVDVQVLKSPSVDLAGVAHGCVARDDVAVAIAGVGPGTLYVTADTYGAAGKTSPGAYTLAIELDVPDAWQEVAVAPGVLWRKKVYTSLEGGAQTANVLEIDLADPHVEVRPWWGAKACETTSTAGGNAGALAAINGGFFDTSTCGAMGMVKIDGTVYAYNSPFMEPQATLGLTAQSSAVIASWPTDKDWPAVAGAIGGHPNLVTAGAIDIWPVKAQALYDDRNPRTGAAITASGKLLLVTVDGRTDAGAGMTMTEFAQYLVWLGAESAVNLDGGGSTTMWIAGESINGVVNSPSDNQKFDHWGQRAVADGLLVIGK